MCCQGHLIWPADGWLQLLPRRLSLCFLAQLNLAGFHHAGYHVGYSSFSNECCFLCLHGIPGSIGWCAGEVQMMDAAASQLSAAIFALMCSLTARNHHGPGLMGIFYHISFARWGLEGTPSAPTRYDILLYFQHAIGWYLSDTRESHGAARSVQLPNRPCRIGCLAPCQASALCLKHSRGCTASLQSCSLWWAIMNGPPMSNSFPVAAYAMTTSHRKKGSS